MPNLMFMRQSSIWPIFCQLMAILAKLLDMVFKFVLPSIYSNFDIQTNFEVNQTQIFWRPKSKKQIWSPYLTIWPSIGKK